MIKGAAVAALKILSLLAIVAVVMLLYCTLREAVRWARRPDWVRATGWSWWEYTKRAIAAKDLDNFHGRLREDYQDKKAGEAA